MSIPKKLRQAYHNDLTDVPLLLEAADEIDRLEAKANTLEGQVKRLLAKEGERIAAALAINQSIQRRGDR